jgi:hypothetical protein
VNRSAGFALRPQHELRARQTSERFLCQYHSFPVTRHTLPASSIVLANLSSGYSFGYNAQISKSELRKSARTPTRLDKAGESLSGR